MERLVGNGTHLYRRNSHLVRTPIRVSMPIAAERAYYAVAGTYNNANFPNSGWLDSMTQNNVIKVGGQCIYAALNPPGTNQHWRQVTNQHDPETAWYQGAYGTSASSMSLAQNSAEAYMQFCAYRFVMPPTLADLAITNVKVSFINGGAINCYGPAYLRSANNRALKGFGDFDYWNIPFYVTEYVQQSSSQIPPLDTPQTIINTKPYDASIDILADTGDYRGDRNLWNFDSTTRDGGIPALVSPPTKTYNMGASTLAFVNQHRDFWITPIIPCRYNSATQGGYAPYYVNTTGGWWGCISLWGISIEATFGSP